MSGAARLDVTWVELEAAAITAALEARPADGALAINVSLDGLAHSAVREALSGDPTGVILEITENTDSGLTNLRGGHPGTDAPLRALVVEDVSI